MRCHYKLLGIVLITCIQTSFSQKKDHYVEQRNAQKSVMHSSGYIVRVLLDECDWNAEHCWQFLTEKNLWLINPQKTKHNILKCNHKIVVRVHKGTVFVNNTKIKTPFFIKSHNDRISWNNLTYQGSLLVTMYKKRLLLINCIGLEDYIFSVLRSESWPGWPLEVNKVFAIASRSYVISKMYEASHSARPYHVRNTNIHQTYNGIHSTVALKDAVEQTRGIFLAYENRPIVAMFDSCCGGIIPAHVHGIDFSKAPYLARQYACKHCKPCKIFSWRAEYDLMYLEELIKKVVPTIKGLKNIKISKKDRAGLIHEVIIDGSGITKALSGKKFYSLLKEVKSFCFSVHKKGRTIILSGRGYGHHLGLCQWGAREMVRDNWDYKRILQFYYPGTRFMKLI